MSESIQEKKRTEPFFRFFRAGPNLPCEKCKREKVVHELVLGTLKKKYIAKLKHRCSIGCELNLQETTYYLVDEKTAQGLKKKAAVMKETAEVIEKKN